MSRKLDIDHWVRKEHYLFFKDFDEPFFGVVVDLDCTIAYQLCKEKGYSFFLYYMHKSLMAVNQVEAFAYRIMDDEVIIHDQVDAGSTINRPNGTFGFSYIPYIEDYHAFVAVAQKEIERVRKNTDLTPAISGENVIHYSTVPWIKFTGISHARHFAFPDSCPKISFGKLTEEDGRRIMPMSVHVHHALMDGWQVSQYIDTLQAALNETG